MKILPIFFLLATSACFPQFPEEYMEAKMDSLFGEYDSDTPGVAIAVIKQGRTVFQKGYGKANLEYDIPIRPNTIFHVASVSKQFTAFAIYLLEKQGRLSFEDDIRKYIPELPDYGKIIRIRHLLAHTSGLRDQWAILALAGWRLEDVITTNQILRLVSKQRELNFQTGSAFGYSNTGYTLLAETLERITGQSFSDFTKANIFKPLGMENTLFYDDFHKILENRAYSYEKKNDHFLKKELHYSNVGPTSLMTTVEDLAKWANNFQTPIIGDEHLLKEFNKVSSLDNNKPVIWSAIPNDTTYHAKGQLLWNYKGLPVISHGGHDAGFRAVMTRFPENDLSIITLSNNEHFQMLGKVLPIADLYLQDQFREVPISNTGASHDLAKEAGEAYKNSLSDYVGNYASTELSTEYELGIRNGALIMTHKRLPDMELTEIGRDKFSGTNTFGFEIEFTRRGQRIIAFEISNFGAKRVRFEREGMWSNKADYDGIRASSLVDEQLKAYNLRDLEAFLRPYGPQIEIADFPNNIHGKGRQFLKGNYGELFLKSPNLHCELINRMILGNTVIDHEKVSGLSDLAPFEAIAIYTIENNKIAKVHFIRKID